MKKNLSNISIDENETLLVAIKKIQLNKHREVLVLSKNKIKGIISEGDILRSLLGGAQIFSSIKPYFNKNFKYLLKLDYNKAARLFAKYNFNIIPIIGKNYELKNFITFKEIIKMKIKSK